MGVQQKALVITSNYTARACGVQKGDSLQVVKEKCPEITICNGEDLTFYGQVGRAGHGSHHYYYYCYYYGYYIYI